LLVMPNNQVAQATIQQFLGFYEIESAGVSYNTILVESNGVVFSAGYSIADPNEDWEGWLSYGSPSDTITVSSPMGIGNNGDTFVKGSDGGLWLWSFTWAWLSMGKPSSIANLGSSMGTLGPTPETYTFAEGTNGGETRVYMHITDANSDSQGWTDMGKPDGTSIGSSMGAVMLGSNPNVFIRATDENLWRMSAKFSRTGGLDTAWINLGTPVSGIVSSMGGVEINDVPYIFVEGYDDKLWVFTWGLGTPTKGTPTNTWLPLGSPMDGVKLGISMGALASTTGKIHVFVKSVNGDLWMNTFDPVTGTGDWENLETPGTVVAPNDSRRLSSKSRKGKKKKKPRRKPRPKRRRRPKRKRRRKIPTTSPSTAPGTSTGPSTAPSIGPSPATSPSPSAAPSPDPSTSPSTSPSTNPNISPSVSPSTAPSTSLSNGPSSGPSAATSPSPSAAPSPGPIAGPSTSPSTNPNISPSVSPSTALGTSTGPSNAPSTGPSTASSTGPSAATSPSPSAAPSTYPSNGPITSPSTNPSISPSVSPRTSPSTSPTDGPSTVPSTIPSMSPSTAAVTIQSGMGVVLGADGVPSVIVEASDGKVWVNWLDGNANARVWTAGVSDSSLNQS
jgi:hypothetical protein